MEKINDNPEQTIAPYMPQSVEDENYLLGRCFYSVDNAEEILSKVELEDFFNPLNRKVFRVIEFLTECGEFVSPVSIQNEIMRREEKVEGFIPFDIPTVYDLQMRYQKVFQITENEGIDGATRRLREDRQYREIIYRANDAVLMARARESKPEEIIVPLETLAYEMQRSKNNVIVWADEAEREAQKKYDQMDKGEILTTPTGYPEIDKRLWGGGKAGGDFNIVSGVTSGGKTTFCLNTAKNGAELGIPSLYFTTEMKTFKVFTRQLAAVSLIPGYKIRPKMSELYPNLHIREKLYDSGAFMAKLPLGYVDTVRDMQTLRRVCKFAVREYGIREAYIDLLGHFRPTKSFRGSPFERMSAVAELGKEIAQELDITLTATVQLRRKNASEKGSKQDREEDVEGNLIEPSLDMLKNSGELENSADTVIFLWGEKGLEGETDAVRHIYGKVAKQREGELFRFDLKFAPSIFTFSSIERLRDLRAKMEEAEF